MVWCECWSTWFGAESTALHYSNGGSDTYCEKGLPWEMLYADDLVLVRNREEKWKEKLRKWNECLKDKGLKINEDKTKVMCESFGTGTTQVIGNVKHPCSVCLKGVGVNSISCTQLCTMGSCKVQQSERLSEEGRE